MKENYSTLYENYHQNRILQKRLISNRDFTYQYILRYLNKYVKQNYYVLDIGCGTGTLSLYLAARGNFVVGIDVSKKAIAICIRNANNLNLSRNISFLVSNFPHSSFKKKFDLVICSEVIEHIEHDTVALKKIYELLNPKGIVILSTPSLNAPLYRLGLLKNFDTNVGHIRRYTVQDLIVLSEKNKFKILEVYKTEGIIRNFLFTNSIAGNFIRIVNKFYLLSVIITLIDTLSLHLFGESQIFVILQKK